MKVKSSTIDEVFYTEAVNELRIKFLTGAEYVYRGVSHQVFKTFLLSKSKGMYFHKHINGIYNYSKVK